MPWCTPLTRPKLSQFPLLQKGTQIPVIARSLVPTLASLPQLRVQRPCINVLGTAVLDPDPTLDGKTDSLRLDLRKAIYGRGREARLGLAPAANHNQEYGRSEFRLVGLRDRNEALIEMILIVLGTDHLVERHFLLTLVTSVTLNRVPRHRECTGILNVNLVRLIARAELTHES